MRISDIRSTVNAGGSLLQARFAWEDSSREEQEVFFEVEGASRASWVDPNTFLLAAYPIAVAHGERRIAIEEPTSSLLHERLHDVHGWWQKWGLAPLDAPLIESPRADNGVPDRHDRRSVAFLSGGVDSLYMLHRNLSRFPPGNEYRIAEALYVLAHEPDVIEEQLAFSGGQVAHSLSEIAAEAGIVLRRVRSNLRVLDPSGQLWRKQFHGPAMAATAHAAIQERAIVHIAGTYDIRNMSPHGSHPLIDPNLGTERISILHCDSTVSRLEKVRVLATWPRALASLCVCNAEIPGMYNCGKCEKCRRTKLEIAAVGAEIPATFADRSLEARALPGNTSEYQLACYRDIIAPLRERGMHELVWAVRWHLVSFRPRRQLKRWKRALLHRARGAGHWHTVLVSRLLTLTRLGCLLSFCP